MGFTLGSTWVSLWYSLGYSLGTLLFHFGSHFWVSLLGLTLGLTWGLTWGSLGAHLGPHLGLTWGSLGTPGAHCALTLTSWDPESGKIGENCDPERALKESVLRVALARSVRTPSDRTNGVPASTGAQLSLFQLLPQGAPNWFPLASSWRPLWRPKWTQSPWQPFCVHIESTLCPHCVHFCSMQSPCSLHKFPYSFHDQKASIYYTLGPFLAPSYSLGWLME